VDADSHRPASAKAAFALEAGRPSAKGKFMMKQASSLRPTTTTSRITKRQGEFLAFILRYTQKRGIAPSYEDMATHFGISSPSVNGMMKTLERNGFISRVPGAARTVRVEVRPEDLPESEFASPTRHRPTSAVQGPAPSSTAASAAIAVLDAVMPRLLELGVADHDALDAVGTAAERVKEVLERAGFAPAEALAAARQVAAEAPRWRPEGRGVYVQRRTWQKRR
jgi:DNA-binding MarR family transcriptional regulator